MKSKTTLSREETKLYKPVELLVTAFGVSSYAATAGSLERFNLVSNDWSITLIGAMVGVGVFWLLNRLFRSATWWRSSKVARGMEAVNFLLMVAVSVTIVVSLALDW